MFATRGIAGVKARSHKDIQFGGVRDGGSSSGAGRSSSLRFPSCSQRSWSPSQAAPVRGRRERMRRGPTGSRARAAPAPRQRRHRRWPRPATAGPQVIDGTVPGNLARRRARCRCCRCRSRRSTRSRIESLKPSGTVPGAKDPVVQKAKGSGPISGPIQNFDGICLPFGPPCAQPSSCSCLPPDTDGEVGATQYVQMVNSDFVGLLEGRRRAARRDADQPALGRARAASVQDPQRRRPGGGLRPTGQPLAAVAVHRAADGHRASTRQCIAVSTTSSATGSYYLYEFDFGRTFHDYPKLGVWPDAYYMSSNEFPDGSQTSAGAGAFAFERAKMLAGQPARVVYFDESAYNPAGGQYIGQLPSDLDGSTLPPAGSPNLFAEVDDASTIPPTDGSDGFVLRLWKFHVDWANPSNSTFGEQRPAELHAAGRAVRPAAVRLRLRRLRPAEGRPAGARRPRRPADVPDELPELRQLRVGAAEPHGQGRRPHGHPLVRAAHPEGRRSLDLPAGHLRAHRQRDQPGLALDGQRSPRTRRATSPPASAPPGRTTTRRSATPAAPPATRSGR